MMRIENLLQKADPERICCEDDQGIYSYYEINQRVECAKETLWQNGVQKSDRVAVWSENSASFIVGIMAVLSAGAVAIPIDPQTPLPVALELIRDCEAKFVWISGIRPERHWANPGGQIPADLVVIREQEAETCRFIPGPGGVVPSTDTDPAFIFYTSGTSGKPKGVVHSRLTIMTNVNAILDYMRPTEDDIFYIMKTAVHCSTLIGEILIALQVGAKMIMKNPKTSPVNICKRIEQYKPTIIGLNPTILRLLVNTNCKYDLSSVRLIFSSGAVATEELLVAAERFFAHAQICNVYGLTEAGPRVSAQQPNGRRIKYDSVGRPVKGVEVEIRNAAQTKCVPGEQGEVFVKTPSLMLQYWNNPEETSKKIIDSWLRTGDLGYWDDEGEIFIVGRADDMIIRSSHNVDPYKIEMCVNRFPGIQSSVVFGVADPLNGQNIICAIVQEPGMMVNLTELHQHCAENLQAYECPQRSVCWAELPMTTGGKVSRKLARDRYMLDRE